MSPSRRDFSILGDELERHRIQLEHDLQHTNLSLHLSSEQDDDAADADSVEYPRHGSAPDQFHGFVSFDRHSQDPLDLEASHMRAWSIHDDEGIAPYDVRTMSTAAHHASAVTIMAGLNRGGRREQSISGAEYDPERPLQDIIAAHASLDAEDAEKSQEIPRPKLSETLQRVGFSPKRPRGGHPRGLTDSSQRHADANTSRRSMTPRARKATVSFDTNATPIRRHASQPAVVQPQVHVQPPTPSTSGSRFTKMARGLTRDVRQAQEDSQRADVPAPVSGHRVKESHRVIAEAGDLNHESRIAKKSNRSRLHLPDVTGLTNAVISPAKVHLERYSVRSASSKEVEARLVASLNALHTRLNHLETENSIARRRVRELEYELEECKRDVVRERTRIIESQDAIDVGAARIAVPSTSRTKGKERRHKDIDANTSKYYEVVQEKKALEALITTLRSHLMRVTSDLAGQQQLLEELRRLRESDALSLAEKTEEINQLRTEVERLAGEIEVLRGVVEEGLNERRQGREASLKEENDLPMSPPRINPQRSLSPVIDSVEPSVRRFIDDDEIDRISEDLVERRSERASNASTHSLFDGDESQISDKGCTSLRSRRRTHVQNYDVHDDRGNDRQGKGNPPFPRITSERMERLFFSAPRHNSGSCRMCKGHHRTHGSGGHQAKQPLLEGQEDVNNEQLDEGASSWPPSERQREGGRGLPRMFTIEEILERMDKNGGALRPCEIPPQTVLARVVGELEDEFAHFREIYGGLAEEYRSLDCATQAAKRHVVGDRLQDVIEILERKGNQIASLYDLLIFKDKSLER